MNESQIVGTTEPRPLIEVGVNDAGIYSTVFLLEQHEEDEDKNGNGDEGCVGHCRTQEITIHPDDVSRVVVLLQSARDRARIVIRGAR